MLPIRRLTLIAAFLCLFLVSCSDSEEPEQTGVIKQTQDKIAQEAVDRIKTPIDQAKMAKELTEGHNKQINEAMEQQQ